MTIVSLGVGASVPGFDDFYARYLNRQPGRQVRSTELRQLYLDYAMATGAPGLGFKELKRRLQQRGHRSFRSNQIYYADLMISVEADTAALSKHAVNAGAALAADQILAAIERAIGGMEATRQRLLRDLGSAAGCGSVAA